MHVPVQIPCCSVGYRKGKKPHPTILVFLTFCFLVLKGHLFSRHHFIALKNTFSSLRSEYDKPSGDLLTREFSQFSADTEVKAGYQSQCRLQSNYLTKKLPDSTTVKLYGAKSIFAGSTEMKLKKKLCRTDYITSNKSHKT